MAIIKFIQEINLEVIKNPSDEDNIEGNEETFRVGSVFDVELLDDCPEKIDIRFGDGSVCYYIPKDVVEINRD